MAKTERKGMYCPKPGQGADDYPADYGNGLTAEDDPVRNPRFCYDAAMRRLEGFCAGFEGLGFRQRPLPSNLREASVGVIASETAKTDLRLREFFRGEIDYIPANMNVPGAIAASIAESGRYDVLLVARGGLECECFNDERIFAALLGTPETQCRMAAIGHRGTMPLASAFFDFRAASPSSFVHEIREFTASCERMAEFFPFLISFGQIIGSYNLDGKESVLLAQILKHDFLYGSACSPAPGACRVPAVFPKEGGWSEAAEKLVEKGLIRLEKGAMRPDFRQLENVIRICEQKNFNFLVDAGGVASRCSSTRKSTEAKRRSTVPKETVESFPA